MSAVIMTVMLAVLPLSGDTQAHAAGTEGSGNGGNTENTATPTPVPPEAPEIIINIPEEWHAGHATVTFEVKPKDSEPKFQLAKAEARLGQKGKKKDVTDTMSFEVNENRLVFLTVTDITGYTFEESAEIKCIEDSKPVFNASVSNGYLYVEPQDSQSGVASVFVNGYEFTELKDGKLSLRLQQFDASYEYFTIQVSDRAGNISDTGRVRNPYYLTDEEKKDGDPLTGQLPVSALPTDPSDATGTVTMHVRTDSEGNMIPIDDPEYQEIYMTDDDGTVYPVYVEKPADADREGREFYTVSTDNGKIFYLVIERSGSSEKVYFLTEISENDLLNVTENTDVLPRNSVAKDSAVSSPGGSYQGSGQSSGGGTSQYDGGADEPDSSSGEKTWLQKNMIYVVIAGIGVLVIIFGGYKKLGKKKKGGSFDDDTAEEEPDDDSEGDDGDEDDDDDDGDEGDSDDDGVSDEDGDTDEDGDDGTDDGDDSDDGVNG